MLGKLTKYEIKATSRTFLPLYALLIIVAGINRIFMFASEDSKITQVSRTIAMMAFVFIIISIFVLTYICMIQRYYKNLVQQEGYLMHTLPVGKTSLIMSKLITSIMWIVASIIIALLSIFILTGFKDNATILFPALATLIKDAYRELGMNLVFFIIEGIVMLIVSIASSILMVYAAISIGQLFNKNRVIASFGAYIVISIILQLIGTILIIVSANFVPNNVLDGVLNAPALLHCIFIGITVISLIGSAMFFFISKHILSKKLNLE
ncbi:MAG: hypothetical protein RR497_02635 [Oscillospiraceae bacterium]